MRTLAALLLLMVCTWLSTDAQEPKPKPKPADKVVPKAEKEPVPGRKLKKIEGFNFLISEEALNADDTKYERPPLDVLELECKQLSKMLTPKAVELLRRLTIFVDWDEQVKLSNGRSGNALASYYGSTAQQIVREGKHPLQAKGVTIHSLKMLTEGRQPKSDSRSSSLLLHEFAHAVHDQLFGYDHAGIKAAYEQAMERRLYEKDFYASTNHLEFFAEMTCAYLDRLWYYPHNRADLKKHDPVTHKTLESLWGNVSSGKNELLPLAHSENTSLDVAFPADLKLGELIHGPALEMEKLTGKIVLVGFWGAEFTNVLNRLDRLQSELGDYGLVVIAAHAYGRTDAEIKAIAEERASVVSVVNRSFVKDGDGPRLKSQPGGHALLFDGTGKCIYRGSAYDADEAVRAAIGKALVKEALGSDEVPKVFKPVADAFAAGGTPVSVYPKFSTLLTAMDQETKASAKKLAELILAPGLKAMSEAQAAAKSDPVSAFITAENIAARYKGTPLAAKATTLTTELRRDKAVAAELKARQLSTQIEQLCGKLRGQQGSINPGDTAFQTKFKPTLDQIRANLEQLRKQYPTSRATANAEKAAREFGIP